MSSSSRICSSAESTSLRVDTWCCASTARHGASRSGRSSEAPAHRVQILDDIDEPLHGANAFGGNAADMVILGVQPLSRPVVVAANESVEAAVHAKKQQCELAFLALR